MPLMHSWTEISVEESLLVAVVKELLALATNPNHVEVVYGTTGRVILADPELAETWFQSVNKKDDDPEPDTVVQAHGFEVVASENTSDVKVAAAVDKVEAAAAPAEPIVAKEKTILTASAVGTVESARVPMTPVKRGPGRPRKEVPPSASTGEES